MPIIGIDLTITNLIPDGVYTGIVKSLTYQISNTPKPEEPGKFSWSKDAVLEVDFSAWSQVSDNMRRLHYQITIPGKPSAFNDLYMGESSRGFLQGFMKACNVPYTVAGFDPELAVGKQVKLEVSTVVNDRGTKNEISYSKV